MAFLDNSGDIILDAVLTDTGRFRLAKGDGSFRITKFALADDEINYKLYNKNNPSGSAYYDLEILQTPILEAFTNNTSTMQHKLLSIPRTNLLYLPAMLINDLANNNALTVPESNGFAVAVTDGTYAEFQTGQNAPGVMPGESGFTAQHIRIDQGLDTDEISWQYIIDQDLMETQYIIEIDSRLGICASFETNAAPATISFVDDDNIASYYVSKTSDPGYVMNIRDISGMNFNAVGATTLPAKAIIKGPQGSALRFRIISTIELISSNFLFEQIGATLTNPTDWGVLAASTKSFKYIDSTIKITGATTGYRLNIPIRFIKCTDC